MLACLALAGCWYWFVHGGRGAWLANSALVEDRLAAVALLRGNGSGLASRTLMKLAADPDLAVAVNAVRALGQVTSARNQSALEGMALSDARGNIRGAASAALGRFPGCDMHALTVMLQKDSDQAARAGAAEGLGIRGDRDCLPALADALDDSALAVRVCAFTAIGKITGQRFEYHPADPPQKRAQDVAALKRVLVP